MPNNVLAYSPTLALIESHVAIYKIYILRNPIDNKIFYVGQTMQSLETRLSGHKTHTNNFTCTHPEFKGESGLMSSQPGRTIHFNHEGDCTTPNWCPFLNPKP